MSHCPAGTEVLAFALSRCPLSLIAVYARDGSAPHDPAILSP